MLPEILEMSFYQTVVAFFSFLLLFLLSSFYVYGCLGYMYVCVPHAFLVPRSGQKVALDVLELQLQTILMMWELRLDPLDKKSVITSEPSFQTPLLSFLITILYYKNIQYILIFELVSCGKNFLRV